MKKSKVWLITGISSGLGKALAEAVIEGGGFVIGTMRNHELISAFNIKYAGKAQAVHLELTDEASQLELAGFVSTNYPELDVLVNNAGYGFAGAIEEASMDEIRSVMEVNFFGCLAITKLLLPIFRRQKSGHIVQISSHGGVKAFAGFGVYNASKFALEGYSEALAAELKPLNINVTLIEPGPFRTGFADHSFKQAKNIITDYDQTAGTFRQRMSSVNGKQEGDPVKAASAIVEMVNGSNFPLRMPLGPTALQTIEAKLNSVREDIINGADVARATAF